MDIANQCFLNAEEAAAARKAHGKNANEPIRVNGYSDTASIDKVLRFLNTDGRSIQVVDGRIYQTDVKATNIKYENAL